MALGGGTFTVQNKILPGTYINFVSLASASATLSDRGIATMPLELDWGIEGEVFEVTSADFQKNSLKLFGYSYEHEKLKGLRDLFKNIHTLFAYRLNGGGVKASNTYATAKYPGVRGNDIQIVIQKNVENTSLFDVSTVIGTTTVDKQSVESAKTLKDNDFVTFNTSSSLSVVAGSPLTGGTNSELVGNTYQTYLNKIESYSFNALGVATTSEEIKSLIVAFTKRLRDELGVKFQSVVYSKAADYEGVINVKNKVADEGVSEASLVYWVTGAAAGCPVNKSNLNKLYDGEFSVDTNYTQAQLTQCIQNGEFVLHKVGSDVRVLEDVNSLKTTTDEKGDVFKDNHTIRVIDQIANDTAVIFNEKYLGSVPNDEAGRTSLWLDLVKQREHLQTIRAIENFNEKDITVAKGDTKKSVVINDAIEPVNAMAKLYMTTTIA